MKKIYNFNRAFAAEDIAQGEAENIISFSVASSEPYVREDKNGKKFAEVLEISEAAIDFSRLVDNRAPLLFAHDAERQLGVVEKAWIENNKLYVQCKFSSNAFPQSILRDINDGIRRNVSIGYQVLNFNFDRGVEDGVPVMNVTRWLPLEASIVSIPADATVGVGRSFESVDDEMEDKECEADKTTDEAKACESASSEDETKECGEDEQNRNADTAEERKESIPEGAEEAPEEKACGEDEEPTKELDEGDEDETKEKAVCPDCGHEPCTCEEDKKKATEVAEIRSLGELTGKRELAESFINDNRSLDEFKTAIKELNTKELNVKDNITMEEKFSLLKAIRGYTSKAPVDFAESYEYKVNEENKRNFGITDADIVLTAEQLRAFDGNEALNQVVYRPDLYTGVLRPESVLAKTGVTVVAVDGPSISFPVATSGVNAGWVDINGNVPSATMDFALRQMTPKKAGAFVDISFQSLLQDDPSAEAIVMDDIVKALDQVLDEGAIKGTGADGQPSGIITNGDINTVPVSGAFTLSGVYGMEAKIRESYDYSDNLKFVCNTKNYYKYATTPYSAVEQNKFLLENGKMIGHDVVICNALDDNTIILGNFDELILANFRGITLKIVEDATLARKQAVEIVAHAAVDFLCRRPKSFTKTVA